MAMVDTTFFQLVYHGDEAALCDFEALESRAEDVIGAMTRWQVDANTIATFPDFVQTLYKKAICAQVDFFAVNGLESVAGGSDRGFTVGKVSVTGKSASTLRTGVMSANVSPMAIAFLEQTGLLYPGVPVVGGCPC